MLTILEVKILVNDQYGHCDTILLGVFDNSVLLDIAERKAAMFYCNKLPIFSKTLVELNTLRECGKK